MSGGFVYSNVCVETLDNGIDRAISRNHAGVVCRVNPKIKVMSFTLVNPGGAQVTMNGVFADDEILPGEIIGEYTGLLTESGQGSEFRPYSYMIMDGKLRDAAVIGITARMPDKEVVAFDAEEDESGNLTGVYAEELAIVDDFIQHHSYEVDASEVGNELRFLNTPLSMGGANVYARAGSADMLLHGWYDRGGKGKKIRNENGRLIVPERYATSTRRDSMYLPRIYMFSSKVIPKGEQLLVYYSEEYMEMLRSRFEVFDFSGKDRVTASAAVHTDAVGDAKSRSEGLYLKQLHWEVLNDHVHEIYTVTPDRKKDKIEGAPYPVINRLSPAVSPYSVPLTGEYVQNSYRVSLARLGAALQSTLYVDKKGGDAARKCAEYVRRAMDTLTVSMQAVAP